MRRWKGNVPENASLLGDDDEVALYMLHSSTADYLNLKLVAKGRRASKANFWLGWKIKDDRFTVTRDGMLLGEQWPEKIRFVENTINEYLLIWA